MQLLYYPWSPNYDFLWDTEVLNYVQTPVKYVQIDYIIRTMSGDAFLALFYVVYIAVLLMTLLICIIRENDNKSGV